MILYASPSIHENTNEAQDDEKGPLGPAQVECEGLEIIYLTCPDAKVLQGLDVEV
jgi:hypothetical protein